MILIAFLCLTNFLFLLKMAAVNRIFEVLLAFEPGRALPCQAFRHPFRRGDLLLADPVDMDAGRDRDAARQVLFDAFEKDLGQENVLMEATVMAEELDLLYFLAGRIISQDPA